MPKTRKNYLKAGVAFGVTALSLTAPVTALLPLAAPALTVCFGGFAALAMIEIAADAVLPRRDRRQGRVRRAVARVLGRIDPEP